jgi:chromosome segregation ATPase
MNLKEHAAMCLWQNKACAWQGRAERAEAEVERLKAEVEAIKGDRDRSRGKTGELMGRLHHAEAEVSRLSHVAGEYTRDVAGFRRADAELARLRATVATLEAACRHAASEIRRAAAFPSSLYGLGSIADTLDAALTAADGGGA